MKGMATNKFKYKKTWMIVCNTTEAKLLFFRKICQLKNGHSTTGILQWKQGFIHIVLTYKPHIPLHFPEKQI